MNDQTIKDRTKRLALDVIALVNELPETPAAQLIGKELVHSAAALGAHYRTACRRKTRSETVTGLAVVQEDADETLYWLELLAESGTASAEQIEPLTRATNELTDMTAASAEAARGTAGLTARR
ncbi:MAG: four helix bundle protein [Nitrospiraceae bacterium]|nr:four helix bundle protein [Nitrospiraceae bacterium]